MVHEIYSWCFWLCLTQSRRNFSFWGKWYMYRSVILTPDLSRSFEVIQGTRLKMAYSSDTFWLNRVI